VEPTWDGIADASGYLVHRWNPATGAYEKLTAEPGTDQSYTDSTAEPGTTHFYRLTRRVSDGTESAPDAARVILPPVRRSNFDPSSLRPCGGPPRDRGLGTDGGFQQKPEVRAYAKGGDRCRSTSSGPS
jgi:hypothetical protein